MVLLVVPVGFGVVFLTLAPAETLLAETFVGVVLLVVEGMVVEEDLVVVLSTDGVVVLDALELLPKDGFLLELLVDDGFDTAALLTELGVNLLVDAT